MRLIDADTLHIDIIEKGQANERGKYIVGDIWELTGAEIREVIDSQPTINPEPHWIPVTERLPDVGVDGEIEILGYEQLAIADSTFKISNPVLATRKIDDRYELAVLQWEVDGNDRKYWVDDGGDIIKGVTAWMPLPEPFKGVTE